MTRTIRQILSAGVLLAYSLGGTSLGSGLFTLLATWSGSHQVTVRAQETGEVEVVLHHQQGNFTPYASDHRDVLAQVLASISGSNDLGDHVLTQHLAKAKVNLSDLSTHRTESKGNPSGYILYLEGEAPDGVTPGFLENDLRTALAEMGVTVSVKALTSQTL